MLQTRLQTHGTQHSTTMIYLAGLVGILLVLTAEARVGNSSELEFCTETEECLLYKLICKNDEYEARYYDSVTWVSTEEISWFMDFAVMKAFRRLFDYISANKIEMTAPVVIKIPDDKSFWQKGTYKLSFVLPTKHQANPPMPTDPKVFIDKVPGMKVYVRSYGGMMMSWCDKSEAGTLSDSLDAMGADYIKTFHYAAGYNSPMQLFNRHNEVWYVVDDDPVCGSSESMET